MPHGFLLQRIEFGLTHIVILYNTSFEVFHRGELI